MRGVSGSRSIPLPRRSSAIANAAIGASEPGLKQLRTARICEAIAARFAEPGFSVATLAKKFFLSDRQIRDILHRTGAGFTERLLEARLTHARELIAQRHSGRKISDIAHSAGFSDLSYFNRVFRRRFGATPSDIRGG